MPPKREEEIVVHCPGRSHTEAQVKITCPGCGRTVSMSSAGPDTLTCRTCRQRLRKSDGESQPATPKILLIAKPGSAGVFKIQCNSNRCKHSQGRNYNGWYEIYLKASGTYTIQPLARGHFAIRTAPSVLLAGER